VGGKGIKRRTRNEEPGRVCLNGGRREREMEEEVGSRKDGEGGGFGLGLPVRQGPQFALGEGGGDSVQRGLEEGYTID
jgi:hypothetical protein